MRVYFLSVLVATWLPSLYGLTITPYPSTTFVGEDVTFVVTGIVGEIRTINWYRGPDASAPNQFLRMDATGAITKGALKIENATLLRNGSLQIRSVQTTDVGNYIIRVQGDELLQAQLNFIVQMPGEVSPEGLSPGAIAGIVVGVIAAAAATSIGVFLYKTNDVSHKGVYYREYSQYETDSLNR